MSKHLFFIVLLLWTLLSLVTKSSALRRKEEGTENADQKNGRVFPLFQVVKFQNMACNSSDGTQFGTCYTATECTTKKGNPDGTCAEGYGVCCFFSLNCGDRTQENGTTFQAMNPQAGSCSVDVCPLNDNIRQIRLDFIKFVINQPSTATDVAGSSIAGQDVSLTGGGKSYSNAGDCLLDQFSVVVPGGAAPSVICGTNSGQHMFVDMPSSGCNTLNFNLAASTVPATARTSRQSATLGANRGWSIRITQYGRDSPNLAPQGCTKYFADPAKSGFIQTYNFDGGIHLANQREKFCVRQEKGTCSVCWVGSAGVTTFDVSGPTTAMGVAGKSSKCCDYGKGGLGTTGYDCLIIPGASDSKSNRLSVSRFCGGGDPMLQGGLFTKSGNTAKTVCSMNVPFMATFYSDNTEMTAEVAANKFNKGIKLQYVLKTC